ncbi:hypothetical protein CRENBAI_002531 [Crenichthys baileyi]|uniref:Uncharacterized protein n=1 Tax=Crenichthys baileyi TaxID=28760 RepID=A0AAV9SME2_9TELE
MNFMHITRFDFDDAQAQKVLVRLLNEPPWKPTVQEAVGWFGSLIEYTGLALKGWFPASYALLGLAPD